MKIKSITERTFYSRNIQKHEMASMLGKEEKWFEESDNNLLATIIRDKVDNDWAYMILAKERNDEYRAVEVDVSFQTMEVAENQLMIKLNKLITSGEYKEELYSDNETSETSSSLIITDINEEVKKYLKKHPEKLHDLSPRKFEELVASILEDMGLDVTLTKETRDGGSDIIARVKNSIASFLILVECKKYSPEHKVNVGIIREVAGVHSLKEPSKSIIVTTSTFTKDAIKEAALHKEKIELKDYYNLKDWLNTY
ncbi:restriction endonuclease [Flavobacterium lindanitolerans]|uniref:Restriction endonuclease n=1 Tax=Flavobacterium lindanitolerans TaxID=428988 RepID=A0A497U4K9_9FLAO|nr:restriction endonuclease [Flavobacterium lindanitolerans]MBC8643975.1 restriction endonuclease [Flavobacterium lindanitolerans]PKW20236.1 restriction endonuclease [Flavobacterium lindanitolerans]RLJ23805.1 restriction endonuclease [Flavobacterium lindanitolerans]